MQQTAETSSKESPDGRPSQSEPQDWFDAMRAKLYGAMNKMNYLPELITWESVRREMNHQDQAARRWLEANHSLLYGDRDEAVKSDDEMGDIVLGDVTTTTQHHHVAKVNGLSRALGAAALMATGAGIALAAPVVIDWWTQEEPAPAVNTDTLLIPSLRDSEESAQ